jgi:hypothetical protein
VEATDFHTGARIQLQELKDELQKLEHQKLKEGEIWERKVKRLEEELDTIHQITLTPKLFAHSGKKGFLRDGDEAQVVVDFLTRVSLARAFSLILDHLEMSYLEGARERGSCSIKCRTKSRLSPSHKNS